MHGGFEHRRRHLNLTKAECVSRVYGGERGEEGGGGLTLAQFSFPPVLQPILLYRLYIQLSLVCIYKTTFSILLP